MRGTADRQETMLTLMTPGKRVPEDHPIRRIKAIADAELERLSPVFDRMYSERGRYSIPPERLLKSCLLIALYSVRSERQFCEQLDYTRQLHSGERLIGRAPLCRKVLRVLAGGPAGVTIGEISMGGESKDQRRPMS